jgi:hypothetical protein
MQGYLFGRPGPIEQIGPIVREGLAPQERAIAAGFDRRAPERSRLRLIRDNTG